MLDSDDTEEDVIPPLVEDGEDEDIDEADDFSTYVNTLELELDIACVVEVCDEVSICVDDDVKICVLVELDDVEFVFEDDDELLEELLDEKLLLELDGMISVLDVLISWPPETASMILTSAGLISSL